MSYNKEVKEERFTIAVTGAAAKPVLYASDSNQIVNGEVLEVISQFREAGSLAIYESGLSSREIWRLNASSGTNPILSYPRALTQANIGSAAAYGVPVPYPVNGPLILSCGSFASGATTTLSVIVRYR